MAWLDQNGLLGPDTRRATSDVTGNYLELVLGDRAPGVLRRPGRHVPADVVDDELTLLHAEPGWRSVLERWDIDVVLWQRGAPLDEFLAADAGWRLAYADQGWVVYRR